VGDGGYYGQCSGDLSREEIPREETEAFDGNPPYKNLPLFLPSTLEELRINGPPKIADDLPLWLEFANSPGWLPELKIIFFHLDCVVREGGMAPSPESPMTISTQFQQFLDVPAANRPSLRIIDN
jgi:hypothetical protein